MSLCPKGSVINYLRLGGRISVPESVICYFLPLAIFCSATFGEFFLWNGLLQLCLFVPVVQLPAFVTGHMSYVDIGWPCGLVLLAWNALRMGTGYWLRRYVVCGFLLLHGARMAFGGLVMFFPYVWKEDLPRYRYAKVRWENKDGMPASGWWLKVQHDTLQQAFANSFVLAAPVMLCAFDASTSLHPIELAGWAMWALSWVWENVADTQKLLFIANCRKLASKSPEKKEELKTAVLGYEPFDTKEYSLWTLCRHPNYFGEWMCWNGFVVAAIPSLLSVQETALVKAGLALSLFYCSRTFYDCLLYWTGSEPAEYFSVQKRPKYTDYQRKVRVFWPLSLPGVDHCRVAGWPAAEHDGKDE